MSKPKEIDMKEVAKRSVEMIDAVNEVLSKLGKQFLDHMHDLEAKGWKPNEADAIVYTATLTAIKMGQKLFPPEVMTHIERAATELVKDIDHTTQITNQIQEIIKGKAATAPNDAADVFDFFTVKGPKEES